MLFPHVGDNFKLEYGRGLLPVLTEKLDNYLVVTDTTVYEMFKDDLKNNYKEIGRAHV